ncbi:MAG: hypothetical protein NZM31_13270 [Gemmatales bacterium]|nr:hypothetical protein [Gemmatales bacterium]MDW8387967.1 hypothetical protein [Gemmatales bacterium]
MTTTQLEEWAAKLQAGTLDVSDLDLLAELRLPSVIDQLKESHPFRFLHRVEPRRRTEIGLARRHRRLRVGSTTTHAYRDCLMLTAEKDRITTWAYLASVKARVCDTESDPITFVSGGGFSLYHDPDGWKIKPLEERTVTLSRETARGRGWLLEPERLSL